jgi:ParB family chromosome partitioning protein
LDVDELIIGRDVIVDANETIADAKFKQLIANVQREDINDIELGHALVELKEKCGYAYKEIAEIIGKTPHYVAAKVGLAKRLTVEMQELVVRDWEAAKCTLNTCKGEDEVETLYVMNVNIIEDIARLPREMQKAAYEAVKDKEMDKKEALRYLKFVKQEAEILLIADDAKGLMQAYQEEDKPGKELFKYIQKIGRDVDKLKVTIKAGSDIDRSEIANALEALIERLNVLYSEVKDETNATIAILQ